MEDKSACNSKACAYVTRGTVGRCPKCGKRMVTSKWQILQGKVHVAVGVLFILLAAVLTAVSAVPDLLHAETNEVGALQLGIYIVLLLFGAFILMIGVSLIDSGQSVRRRPVTGSLTL